MADVVLCLNSGSSSLKWAVYRIGAEELQLAHGAVDAPAGEQADALRQVFSELERRGIDRPAAVGHRLVHGGADHAAPEIVDDTLVDGLRRLIPLAPLHLPAEIAMIEAVGKTFADVTQVACFDTAFHRRMPELAQRLPLPRRLWDEGVRRYGFHGLSYEYVVWKLGDALPGRTIIAHLGNGASLVALRERRPVDTTMGLTPLGGLVMGTRSGDLDPGVLLHLLTQKDYGAERLGALLNDESGMRGVSQLSSDMKTLLRLRGSDPRAAEAVEMFCVSVRKHVGAFASVLGGLDALVFTGAIGEHAAAVRWEICAGLGYLGIQLDRARNEAGADRVSVPGACDVRVVATNEELIIARQTAAAVSRRKRDRAF
ncbi:MAG TPA: acetate/propionate family kinase [Methylomirabilota bacterium]|jgi:acetate kinase